MSKRYGILGAGMQGTAAAYDLALFASPAAVVCGDFSPGVAEASADRVNRLVGRQVCTSAQVDAMDPESLRAFLEPLDCIISCVPYWMHPHIAKVAVETKTDMVDLGGNTDITMETLKLDEAARAAGCTLVPDAGLAPGLVNDLGLYCIEHLDEVDSVRLYCGVLPQNPKQPFNYKLTFNVEGLVTEYDYEATVVRDGKVAKVPTLTEVESLVIDELGEMEAFVTSGGTSTAPYTLAGKVPNYEYKTIRHPGHAALMKIFKDFGFWHEGEIDVKGTKVVPKDVFNAVFGPKLAEYVDDDLCAVRAVGIGKKDGKPAKIQLDIFDKQDPATGFTSMERLTGFSAAIIAQAVAEDRIPAGAVRYEDAMGGHEFVEEIRKRGIEVRVAESAP